LRAPRDPPPLPTRRSSDLAGPITHSTTLSSLPDVPSCCPGYDGGSGLYLAGGPSFEFSFTDRFALNARLLLDRYSGTLETEEGADRKSTRLNSSHVKISYA